MQATFCYLPALRSGMGKKNVSQVLAANLAAAMKRRQLTQPGLAALSRVPQTTISLLLRPNARAPTSGKALPSPTIERVAMLADALGVECWQLLHPDPDQAQRESDFYARLRQDFSALTKKDQQAA